MTISKYERNIYLNLPIAHVVDYEHVAFRDVVELKLQESSRPKMFCEKLVWRICQKSQENTCDEVFLENLQL